MSFPDPDNALSKTQDSLSTQPEWKTTQFSNFRYSVEPVWKAHSSGGTSHPRVSTPAAELNGTVNGLKREDLSHSDAVGRKWLIWTRSAIDSIQGAWHQCPRNRRLFFILAPILVVLLALTLPPSARHSRDLACQLTGHPSFLGCPIVNKPGSQAPESDGKGAGKSNTPVVVQWQIQTLNTVGEKGYREK